MTRLAKGPSALGAVLLLVAPALAASDGRWIHVRVDEDGAHGAKVDVQVPLSMVSALMPTLKAKMDVDGHLDFRSSDVSVDELRSYWKAVKESRDGNYVTVKDGSDTVRIAKRGGVVHVDVDGNGGTERVKMRLPVRLVDAVLGTKDTLDVGALVDALHDVPNGELIAVDDDESKVRIWIDDRPSPSRDEDAP
ncbi:MAG TPA: hypothetical protein VJ826_02035 [Candidatus Polarisedimenticolaceae bacterium]|nr:hypothetical protein [Candidatus Polarisedimenticolaceae bacterium]